MERQLGGVDMVRWQGRRIDPQVRSRTRIAGLVLTFALISFFFLAAGFYSGLPAPVGLLQALAVILMLAAAAFGVRLGVAAVAARKDRRGLRSRRL